MIELAGSGFTEKAAEYARDWLLNRQGHDYRRYVNLCEQWFRDQMGYRFALMTSSCFGALWLAYRAAFILRGLRTVVMPELTYQATALAVDGSGCRNQVVTTVDVDPKTWTVAEMHTGGSPIYAPVWLYGNAPHWGHIAGADAIQDCAEALGSTRGGFPAGTASWIVCYSFNGSKTVGGGEGGMLCTDDLEVYEYAHMARDNGRKPDTADISAQLSGMNWRPNWLGAAAIYANLERLEELVAKKHTINGWYREMLAGWEFQEPTPGCVPCWWLTAVLLPAGSASPESVHVKMLDAQIVTRPVFKPLGAQLWGLPSGKDTRHQHPVAYSLAARGLCLPCPHSLMKDEAAYVTKILKAVC